MTKYKIELTREELEMVYETVSIKFANDRHMLNMIKHDKAFGDIEALKKRIEITNATYQTLRDALNG